MAPQPQICINGSGRQIPVYDPNDSSKRVGTLYPWELFTRTGLHEIFFLSPEGRRYGEIDLYPGSVVPAYQEQFSFGSHKSGTVEGVKFRVRRRCRIFTGETVWDYIYPGEEVVVHPENSFGGYEHPYRLKIEGWISESGATHSIADSWCDTDYEIGYSMYHEVTTYGNWV